MDNGKQTIIFDLGGVLIDWDPRYLYQKIFTDEDEMEFFLTAVCSPEWNAQMDSEKSFLDGIDELIPHHPEYADQIKAYFFRWEEMIRGVFPDVLEILSELRSSGYPLAGLSNWSSETFPFVNARYEFLDWFDPLILSGHVGMVKPDPDIYHLLLCRIDRNPEDCIFIDDMGPNIQAAKDVGLFAIHFKSADQLRKELVGRGIQLDGNID